MVADGASPCQKSDRLCKVWPGILGKGGAGLVWFPCIGRVTRGRQIETRHTIAQSFAAGLSACLLLLAFAPGGWAAKPQRIVSINLCTDQLALLLAQPEQIASLSFMADNPIYSAYAERVGTIPLNHARVEQIVSLQPDLVLAYELSDRQLVGFLRQLGYRVEVIPAPASFQAVEATWMAAARALDVEAEGRALVDDLRAGLTSRRVVAPSSASLAVIYGPNGYSPGTETLQGAVLEAAGLHNLSALLGNRYGGTVPIEQILVHQPQVFILSDEESNADSLAQKKLQHPALRDAMAQATVAEVTGRYWSCPTPRLLEAVDQLRGAAS